MFNLKEFLTYCMTSTSLCPGPEAFHAARAIFRHWAQTHGHNYMELSEGGAEFQCALPRRSIFPTKPGQAQIKVRLRYDPFRELISITAGNTGLPPKTRAYKASCVQIVRELDQAMQLDGCTESPLARQQRLLRLASRLAALTKAWPPHSEVEQKLHKIITGYGEASAANVACAENLTLITDFEQRGLATRSGTLLSMITNAAEGSEPPAQLRKIFPQMTTEEWNATLRICTLLLLDLESTKPESAIRRP